ncbi:uncharacterized protein PHACADRAFT_261096 [Phanerochaete carnosa HHB-10118-sp]|uniref:PARP catalytic domain-containing protein n=1 Tax=Phanerochaete carnosa (strain HHB-10118-sp) TaxID=650164 RepID=K5W0E7_PHACS|nr:uncharacterized protein PHACADRAFT_261096 [Phanerochaete carnosa HHB-10118-sp]EKM52580.1 hypothetical protein PHACADRAFT_261096 [Phanerochaete carnosa HHB-10118-sp]
MSSSNTCALPRCSASVWVDRNGVPSQYCSRSHMKAATQQPVQSSQSQLCKNCGTRPVYVENSRVHDFCGRTCAKAYLQGGNNGRNQNGVDMCLYCEQKPKAWVNGKLKDFCSKDCVDKVSDIAPLLLEVPSSHEQFRSVVDQFNMQWKHPNKKRPEVVKMYKAFPLDSHMNKFKAYKADVGNSRRRWHGTTRYCRIGDDAQNLTFCRNAQCAMCNILQGSFDLSKAARGAGSYQRFGVGIYVSATSSKSNDYIKELGGSSYRAMILSEVIMGKAIKLPREDRTLTQPPPGYNSVVGEPGVTVNLNYDEGVVYKNDAIKPSHLLILKP